MSDQHDHHRRQLADQEASLRLIEQRKSAFVLSTDIPLQLLKEEQHTRARIADLRRQLGAVQVPTLPDPVGDFVGREPIIDAVREVLRTSGLAAPISSIRGMGGIGKTQLAYMLGKQLRDDFPDGQYELLLYGSTQPLAPERALQQIIRDFVPAAQLPDDLPTLTQQYRACLHGKRVLILADDAQDEVQVRPLLPPAGCALLITSRSHIELEGMQTHSLGTLSPVEAEKLLRQICPRIGDDAPELAQLCGYLPLALRVSATFLKRRPTRSVATYLNNLRDERARLAHLRDPKDPMLNVEASLNLSYSALPPDAQQTFAQLGVFMGSFPLEAAQQVVALPDAEPLEDLLEALMMASLLEYDRATERYDLHDLARAFALAHLPDERPARLPPRRLLCPAIAYPCR
ncbi:MAG: hypothetical protein HC893_09490, partial [Chloroflexaceae bacterium]|nr:hypothetical protein [Chloroflexaceae bacterium]